MNKLYYGNNLDVLRDSIATESVDLIYLDPPFNSKRDYNLLFKSPKLTAASAESGYSAAQIEAFEDTWHWTPDVTEREYDEVLTGGNTDVSEMMKALVAFLGRNDMTAYLVMMANRLMELHRVLPALLVLVTIGFKPHSAEAQFLSTQPDLIRKTLQGRNARGVHCEIAFRKMYGGSGSSFTFTDGVHLIEGDMWWYYKNLLIIHFENFGFRGRIYPRKIVMEDVTPVTASVDLHTIFGEAYQSPGQGSGVPEAGNIDCDGQTIRVCIWIYGSVEEAQGQLAIWRRYEGQNTHHDLKPLPDGLGETGYVLPADRADCLSSFVFMRGNVLIMMPETCFRTKPDCDDAILKAARILDTAIAQEQNGVTVIRMPKVLFLKH